MFNNHVLGFVSVFGIIILFFYRYAILAQLVEQLTRNEQVAGSIPADGSNLFRRVASEKFVTISSCAA